MAIPEKIKKLANDVRTKIYGKDVRESLAKGIEEAGNIADEANKQVDSIQDQVNQLVVNGDSSVEAAQARVSSSGITYTTLKERLDKTIILSSSEPDEAEFWYQDKGEALVNFNPDSGISVVNAFTSDNPPSDNSKLWFDVEEA